MSRYMTLCYRVPVYDTVRRLVLQLEALNLRGGDEGRLSTMPDVALATGTLPRQRSMRQQRQQRELELDLGDGTRHYQSH